jgi:hypothetical protein
MAADIDVINSALSKIGEEAILAVTDPSPAARIANRTYGDIRDALIREFPWNFATKRASLAAEVATPVWGAVRQFVLPSDLLRLLEINNTEDQDWRLESGRVVTDMTAPLEIKYVAAVAVDAMDATFREALAARLALEWAESLTQTTSVVNAMASLYSNKLQVARAADGQEDRVRVLDYPDFTDARF